MKPNKTLGLSIATLGFLALGYFGVQRSQEPASTAIAPMSMYLSPQNEKYKRILTNDT
ncbi:MAG: hypothetical protein ACYTX0_30175 [Nostoc sp.]